MQQSVSTDKQTILTDDTIAKLLPECLPEAAEVIIIDSLFNYYLQPVCQSYSKILVSKISVSGLLTATATFMHDKPLYYNP